MLISSETERFHYYLTKQKCLLNRSTMLNNNTATGAVDNNLLSLQGCNGWFNRNFINSKVFEEMKNIWRIHDMQSWMSLHKNKKKFLSIIYFGFIWQFFVMWHANNVHGFKDLSSKWGITSAVAGYLRLLHSILDFSAQKISF